MLFARTTFIVALGVLLLPTDPAKQAQVFGVAKDAAHWTATFCDRNPGGCETGRKAWGVFVEKAQFGAKMAYEIAADHVAGASTPAATPAASTKSRHGTLTKADMQPAFHEPALHDTVARHGG